VPLPAKRQAGFSLLEVVVALVVAIILLAVSLPIFLRAYRSYQLTNAARQVADILRLTRYEAIRLNKKVYCMFQPFAGNPAMMSAFMTDSSGNGLSGMGTATIVLGPTGNLVDASTVPNVAALPAQANAVTTMPVNNFSSTGGQIQFDPRGAVIPPSLTTPTVYAFYLASADPDAGFRAVLLMPAGSLQIWSTDASGTWQEQR
jgi:Tfp pilus assembly protein FimT